MLERIDKPRCCIAICAALAYTQSKLRHPIPTNLDFVRNVVGESRIASGGIVGNVLSTVSFKTPPDRLPR